MDDIGPRESDNPEFFRLLESGDILCEKDFRNLLWKFQGDALAVLMHLVRKYPSKKDELCMLWGNSIDAAYVNLKKTLFQSDIVRSIPERFARKHKVIPIYKLGDAITVAAADPCNRIIMEEVERITTSPVSPVFALPYDIEDAIEIQYQTNNVLNEFIDKVIANLSSAPLFKEHGPISSEDFQKLTGGHAVIEFIRGLLLLAVKERATDIHIEPGNEVIRIRFRIDNVLGERMVLDKALLSAIVSKLKSLAGVDIAETQKPRDGQINLLLVNKTIHLTFSSIPTTCGEKIALGILGEVKDVPELSELCFSKHIHDELKKVSRHSKGVFFAAGPNSSGKTTTLYSLINHINRPEINIMTIEDPVECRLNNVSQVQVNPDADLDFVSGVRSLLKQYADVILIGEIRDLETVKMSVWAALAGHLVLTSLCAENALGTIVQLTEMGLDPMLIKRSVIGIMAQKLVRRLCDQCKVKYQLLPREIENIFIWDGKTKVFFHREEGCSHCNHTGFSDRIPIHEFLTINDELKALIAKKAPIADIRDCAYKAGFQTMRYDGVKKVLRGLTTIEEISKAVVAEEPVTISRAVVAKKQFQQSATT
ncbi:GspE/PulE family protein [Desulfobacterales bacterium HSG2]|nr:GspE/PulE family protein [Desulfobacterales bacterium HSG2]